MSVVVRSTPRDNNDLADAFAHYSVATVHEAQGRRGSMGAAVGPIYPGTRIAGYAVTVSVPPCDNWMIHVAVEQCQDGDIVVVAPTSPSDAGYIGELLATALKYRGVRGVVIDAGCRDVAELQDLAFPVWSRCVSPTGTVKETCGDVNVPIVCAGQLVRPGDIVVADVDGVVVVRQDEAAEQLAASEERERKEEVLRARYGAGELSLDVSGMREALASNGLRYVDPPGFRLARPHSASLEVCP